MCRSEDGFFDSSKSAVVGAGNGRGALAVEEDCYFTKVFALVQVSLSVGCSSLSVVHHANLALPLGYKVKLASFGPLIDYNIIWSSQMRANVLYKEIDYLLKLLEHLVPLKSIYKDV